MEAALYNGSRHLWYTGCRTVNKVPLTATINTRTSKMFEKYSRVSQLLWTHIKLKPIWWIFVFFSSYHSLTMDFLRYFCLQKVTPKIQSWTPRPRWIYRCLTSRKIAHFQSRISSKWLSARSWHSFCPSKPVFSTDPQVHGSQNPLLYRELDCIQFVIRPPDAILDRFTDLHPLRKPDFFYFARKHAEQSKRDSKFSFGYKNGKGLLSRQLWALDLGYAYST